MKKLCWLLMLSLFTLTQGFSQKEDDNNKELMTMPEYISAYSEFARSEMRRSGIPASITLAQGILESKFGNSKLAKKANNHFGIKCGSNWTGPNISMDDDEKGECFRKYKSVLHSYVDHSNFLRKDRYKDLFRLSPKDYKGWARGLKKAGYATNPKYADLLIQLIEDRNLHVYDTEEKVKQLSSEEKEYLKTFDNKFFIFNNIKTVISQPNEMALDLAYKYDIGLGQLLKYNDLNETDFIRPGTKIYLQPKRSKGEEEFHQVEQGETMHSISQDAGMKLNALYKKNLITYGEEPLVGEILCLRKKCDAAPKLKTDADLKNDIKERLNERMDANNEEELEEMLTNKEVKMEETIEEAAEVLIEDNQEYVAEETIAEPRTIVAGRALETHSPEETHVEKVAASIDEKVTPPTSVEEPVNATPSIVYHIAAPKETLYGISRMYNVTVGQIRSWNKLPDNSISIGQKLIVSNDGAGTNVVPPKKEAISPSNATSPMVYHEVKPKETLYGISKIYNVSVEDIKRLNNLTSNGLEIGQKLRVK